MENGSFDLKGLAELAVREGIKKVNPALGWVGDHVVSFVGHGLEAIGIPAKVELDGVQTLIGKLIVEGVKRQGEYDSRLKQQQQSANSEQL
jgi:hypothetical protein